MAGQFSTLSERRPHIMSLDHRAASLDIASPTAPTKRPTSQGTPPPADILIAAASMINSSRSPKASPQKYLCPAHSQIRFGRMNFLITHMPSSEGMDSYVTDLARYHAKTLVRVCDPNYSSDKLKEHGVRIYDLQYEDGKSPPVEVINKFLQLCVDTFSNSSDCIAVHCVAGLGRGPLLVGVALMEAGMKYEDAVFLIRSQRRGALNAKQLEFLQQYKPSNQLKKLRYNEIKQRNKSCAIM